jgi:hypothetical protein
MLMLQKRREGAIKRSKPINMYFILNRKKKKNQRRKVSISESERLGKLLSL